MRVGAIASRAKQLLLCALICCSGRAYAQGAGPLRVSWRSDAGCDAPSDLAGEVARLTRPDIHPSENWSFEVLLTQQSTQTVLLEFGAHGAQSLGTKRLEVASCREAQEAVILLIAMTLDPEAYGAPSTPNPARAPAEPHQELPAVRPTHRPAALSGSLGAAAVFDPWSLRSPTAGPAVFGALSFRSLQVRLAASYLFARDFERVPPGASAKVDLFAGALGAGLRFASAKVAGGPLLELELGALRGRASGVPDARTRATLWAAALAGLWLEVPAFGRLSARFSASAGAPLRRPRFDLQGGPNGYTAPVAFLRLELGLVFRFGRTTEQ